MSNERRDGATPPPEELADRSAISDLAIAYAHAVDDKDWRRWEALFTPDAHIDYRSAGGIQGTPAEVGAWMPDAMAAFTWCMHSISTHHITFTGPDTAVGRAHVHNRNGVVWEGADELFDVGGFYDDEYVRTEAGWRFASRVEKTLYFDGGAFADMVRSAAATN